MIFIGLGKQRRTLGCLIGKLNYRLRCLEQQHRQQSILWKKVKRQRDGLLQVVSYGFGYISTQSLQKVEVLLYSEEID